MKYTLKLNPDLKHTVNERVLPWDGKEVTVISWHQISDNAKKLFPDDEEVGFVEEFCMDIPESELI